MNTSKSNKPNLLKDLESIYKYHSPKIGVNEGDKDKTITIKLERGTSDYKRKDYPVVEYKSDSLVEIGKEISEKVEQILGRPVRTVSNTNLAYDIIVHLYSVKTMEDEQRVILQMEKEEQNLRDLVATLRNNTTETQVEVGSPSTSCSIQSNETLETIETIADSDGKEPEVEELCTPCTLESDLPPLPPAPPELPNLFAHPAPNEVKGVI